MNPVTFTWKIATHFLHMTLQFMMMYHCSKFSYRKFIHSETEILNVCHDLDHEHSYSSIFTGHLGV